MRGVELPPDGQVKYKLFKCSKLTNYFSRRVGSQMTSKYGNEWLSQVPGVTPLVRTDDPMCHGTVYMELFRVYKSFVSFNEALT